MTFLLLPGGGAEYCDQFVCLSVCLSVREHISGTAGPIFTKFCVQIPCGRGSVLLWRRCDMLYTSGFMDDATFGRSGPYGDAWKASGVAIPGQSDVYECLVFCCELDIEPIILIYEFNLDILKTYTCVVKAFSS